MRKHRRQNAQIIRTLSRRTNGFRSLTASPRLRHTRATGFFYALGVFLLSISCASAALANDQAKQLLSLIDYIGGDYKNAVRDGKIADSDEYQEMSEFSKRSIELFDQLKLKEGRDTAGIEKDLRALATHIKNTSGEELVPQLAQQIKDRLIKTYGIVTHPKAVPDYDSAKTVYRENCAQCHGESGRGDGPGAATMQPKEPKPANFTDPDLINNLSPFKAFNTTTFGIQGTGMPSFSALNEEQRWEAAFYLFSLRHSSEAAASGAKLFQAKNIPAEAATVSYLATAPDDELVEKLKAYATNDTEAQQLLAYLRRGVLEGKTSDPLAIAAAFLRESVDLYKKGDREKAYQKAVDAYIDGYDLAEPALFAKDMGFGRDLEAQFTEFRNAIKQGLPAEEIEKRYVDISSKLDRAKQLLTRQDNVSVYYTLINSAFIILREGLEASLIIAAILAMLKVMGANHATRYIHFGWILALLAGGLTWLATQTVLNISGQHRESMEGFITVFAAAALFYVGYWLHTRSETKKWQAFLQDKIKSNLSSKSIFGLMGISFFAVYREAFEVVLFYQALWLQNEDNHQAVLWGFFAGVAVLVAVTLGVLKVGLKVPLKYFFRVTGALLYVMAFIFAGTGIKELQAAGWVSTTPLNFLPQVPSMGIYPMVETLAAQALILCAFIATSVWMARDQEKAN
jgi:high-affinity iron transporter